MDEFSQILSAATAAIENQYFQLPIAGGTPIFRERVYCYELYHQMRNKWPTGSQFMLNGEIDKRAHPVLKGRGTGYAKPDLLIHKPATMDNYAIIEIKHFLEQKGIRKDLKTLDLFRQEAGYKRAIYLIYGPKTDDANVAKIVAVANASNIIGPVEVWLHRRVGQSATLNLTLPRGVRSCARV